MTGHIKAAYDTLLMDLQQMEGTFLFFSSPGRSMRDFMCLNFNVLLIAFNLSLQIISGKVDIREMFTSA